MQDIVMTRMMAKQTLVHLIRKAANSGAEKFLAPPEATAGDIAEVIDRFNEGLSVGDFHAMLDASPASGTLVVRFSPLIP